jgi:hypothetical protein
MNTGSPHPSGQRVEPRPQVLRQRRRRVEHQVEPAEQRLRQPRVALEQRQQHVEPAGHIEIQRRRVRAQVVRRALN